MNKKEIMYDFLKFGFSARELDKRYFNSTETKGWKSWKFLKESYIKSEYKGILFIYSKAEINRILIELKENNSNLKDIIKDKVPKKIENYKNTFILAENEEKCYQILNGNLINLIQSFFNPEKKKVSNCQISNCKGIKLETVHLKNNRPDIFKNILKENKVKKASTYEYDIYKSITKFLYKHNEKDMIIFLCKEHHLELDNKINKIENKKERKQEFANFKNSVEFIK